MPVQKLFHIFLRVLAIGSMITGLIACAGPGLFTPNFVSIRILPSSPAVQVGQQLSFSVSVTDYSGTSNDDPTKYTWSSSDPTVATIDGHGVASTLKAGVTTIKVFNTKHPDRIDQTGLIVTGSVSIAVRAATPATMLVSLAWGESGGAYVLDPSTNTLQLHEQDDAGVFWQKQSVAVPNGKWIVLNNHSDPAALFALTADGRSLYGFRVDSYSGELEPLPGFPRELSEPWIDLGINDDGKQIQGRTREGKSIQEAIRHD